MWKCMYVCIYVCLMYEYIFICMYVCMYVCRWPLPTTRTTISAERETTWSSSPSSAETAALQPMAVSRMYVCMYVCMYAQVFNYTTSYCTPFVVPIYTSQPKCYEVVLYTVTLSDRLPVYLLTRVIVTYSIHWTSTLCHQDLKCMYVCV